MFQYVIYGTTVHVSGGIKPEVSSVPCSFVQCRYVRYTLHTNYRIFYWYVFYVDVSERSIGYPTPSMVPGGIGLNTCAPFRCPITSTIHS